MPFTSRRAKLELSAQELETLERLSNSRSAPAHKIGRAKMLLRYHKGETISAIASALDTNRPKVERTIAKALNVGALTSLDDLPGRGRQPRVTAEARAWVVALACQKPKDLGYSYELWTTDLLSKHIREHCIAEGHPSLDRLARGTVSKLLNANQVRPHKINYYLERRDPDFDAKMAQVLCVYRQVEMWRASGTTPDLVAVLSYDEKPGIQAIANTAPDLPPVPGQNATWSRDHEYVRHGTVSLLAGIDLLTGQTLGIVRDRHRSAEFVEFLKLVDNRYDPGVKARIILDNHSAHTSKETRDFLETKPNRFEFIFTPKHGSWLNLVESFFAKMANTMLRGIRVASKEELKDRIELYLAELNKTPSVFRWKYKIESLNPN